MDTSIFIGTWWSLVPPLLAIILALVTKEVYSSLFIGVAVGALLYTGFHPWNAFNALFAIMKDSMNLNILIFDVLLAADCRSSRDEIQDLLSQAAAAYNPDFRCVVEFDKSYVS